MNLTFRGLWCADGNGRWCHHLSWPILWRWCKQKGSLKDVKIAVGQRISILMSWTNILYIVSLQLAFGFTPPVVDEVWKTWQKNQFFALWVKLPILVFDWKPCVCQVVIMWLNRSPSEFLKNQQNSTKMGFIKKRLGAFESSFFFFNKKGSVEQAKPKRLKRFSPTTGDPRCPRPAVPTWRGWSWTRAKAWWERGWVFLFLGGLPTGLRRARVTFPCFFLK